MNNFQDFSDTISSLKLIYDQLDNGILLINENKVIYFNKQIPKYLDSELLTENIDVSQLFDNAQFAELYKIIGNIEYGINNKIQVSELDKLDYEINISCCNYFTNKIITLVFKNTEYLDSQVYKLEVKLNKNQQRLRKVLDLVPHMISLKDDKGNILLANKACADFYRKNTKEIIYSNIAQIHLNQVDLLNILTQDKEVIESNSTKEWKKFELTDNFNNKKIFNTTKVPFADTEDGKLYSLGIMVDVTQQQLDEAETIEAKEKFRLLVERGSYGIVILQQNKIFYANKLAAWLFGYNLDEFLEKPLQSLIQTNQLQKTYHQFVQNSQKKDILYEMKIIKKDGSFGYIEAKVSTANYLGSKSRLIFLRDISKRKLAEKSGERYKNMLEQAQKITKLGSWEFNLQQKSMYCSDEIFNIVDAQKIDDKVYDSNWFSSFIPKNERLKIYRGLIKSVHSGSRFEIEFPIVTATGNKKIIQSQSQVFYDRHSKPDRLIGTWIDITDQIKFQQILKEAKLKAEESDNLKSAFLANMSHEIRTPMNAILGFANLLKSRSIDDNTHLEYIDHILQSGEGLIKLITDIIDISKIESNQMVIEKSAVRINEILDLIYNRNEELLLIENNASVKLRLEKALNDPDFTVQLDSFRVQQVFTYLITNAFKFASVGTITFGYSITNGELLFYVKDQGIGIPENKKELIFRSFSKLEGPKRMNKSGTGLGLCISKSLVELMGGKIWFETVENKGTSFYFTCPLEYAQQKPLPKTENKFIDFSKEIDLSNKKILIAEDEWLNYKLLETLLKRTGASILWAKNGIEAIEMFKNNAVDLIFMDIKMPEMNGYEATQAIKKLDPSIPIIAQTAFTFSNEQQYILQSGCDMYITKPIKQFEVFKALNNFLIN